MTAVRRFFTIISLSLAATTTLLAQTQTPQRTTEPVTAETDRDVTDPRALQLSLDEAIRTAMQRNLGIDVQRFEVREAGESLQSQYSVYDWFGSATIDQTSAEGATTSTFEATAQRSRRVNAGVSQNLPAGGNYFLGLNNTRSITEGGGTTVSPAYRPSLVFSATQPLLRNFGVDTTRRGIFIARNTLGINREAFRTTLMNTAVSVEQAYLDLVYARRQVDVVRESLFLARDQARITQIRIDVGASAPLDILQPRVTIATSEEQLILAVASVRNAEDRLRALLNLPAEEWDRPIIPTDPVEYRPMTVDTTAAVARALDLRPEVRQQRFTTDTRRVQYMYARNQALPQFDLNVDYTAAGVSGRVLEPGGTTRTIGGETALRQVFTGDFPTWTVGFQIGVPLTNIGARAEARRAELDLQQARVDEAQTRQNITVDVRQAIRDIDTAARSISATRTARDAAERNLEAERRRFENGMTTNFQVLQVQQQLSDARVRELQALVGYNQAVANYHRAVGDVLEVRNIRVEEPEVPQEPRIFSAFDRMNWLEYGNWTEVPPESQPEGTRNDDQRR